MADPQRTTFISVQTETSTTPKLTKLQTKTSGSSGNPTTYGNKSALRKMAKLWKALEDADAQQHVEAVKALGAQMFGDREFGEALTDVVRDA